MNKTKLDLTLCSVLTGDMCEKRIDSTMTDNKGIHEENSRTGLAQYASESAQAKQFPQYLAAIIATLGAFTAGTCLSWSSPAIPILIEQYNKTIPVTVEEESWVGSLVTLGAFSGAIPAGMIANLIGRKRILLLLAAPMFASWLLIAFSRTVLELCLARFLAGFAIGGFSVAIPMYVAELAEPSIRGTLGALFQLQITAGVLFEYAIGVSSDWNLIAFLPAFAVLLFLGLFSFMPESPVYLSSRKQLKEARAALQWFRGQEYDVEDEITKIQDQLAEAEKNKASISDLVCTKAPLRALVIALGLMIFQQLSGINAVIFYTQSIFESSGDFHLPSYAPAIIVGVVMVIATYLSTILIDRAGRRILLLISCSVMAICLAVFSIYFYLEANPEKDAFKLPFIAPLLSIVVYITVFSLGFGPIPWMMLGELFTPKMKGAASSICAAFNWFLAFTVTKFFGNLVASFGLGTTFAVFAIICVFGTIFVFFIVPETKGKDMDEIQQILGADEASAHTQYEVSDDVVVIDIKK